MNARHRLAGSAAFVLVAALLSGCASYDYLERTDRISYHAGDAVNANLERETFDPSNALMYDTRGLGANGSVIPSGDTTTTTTTPPPAAPETNPAPASPI